MKADPQKAEDFYVRRAMAWKTGEQQIESYLAVFGGVKNKASHAAAGVLKRRGEARIRELETRYRAEEAERAEKRDQRAANITGAGAAVLSEAELMLQDAKDRGNLQGQGKAIELIGKLKGAFKDDPPEDDFQARLDGMSPQKLLDYVKSLCQSLDLRVVDGSEEAVRDYIKKNAPLVGLEVIDPSEEEAA